MKTICNLIFLLGISGLVYSQTTTQNYIHTKTMTSADGSQALENIQYFDGLGRLTQTVQKGMTPDKTGDWVSLQTYDGFGRESETWLPAVIHNNAGNYNTISTVKERAIASNFNDTNPYSKTIYESSPLNRVLDQYGPGSTWHTNSKAVKTEYFTNTSKSGTTLTDATIDFLVCAQINCTSSTTYSYTKVYDAGELYVTKLTNEDGNEAYEFKNKLGQIILTRQISSGKLYDTYYVYDDYGNLSAVFPPEASFLIYNDTKQLNAGSDVREKWAYLYIYDNRNRCIEKKLPGADPIYYIYDKADRLIFSQDGEQRKNNRNEWTFFVSDILGRPAMSWRIRGNPSIERNMWKDINSSPIVVASKSNTAPGYTVSAGTLNLKPSQILTINYYDDYSFLAINKLNDKHQYDPKKDYDAKHESATGLLTGSMTTTVYGSGLSSIRSFKAIYYDYRGRVIQTRSTNHLRGEESEYFALNFMGQPLKTMLVHNNPSANKTIEEVYTYSYDHAGRLLKTNLEIDKGPIQLIAENTYDDLGRLQSNKKGDNETLKTNYDYDIRSRTKNMNSIHLHFALDYTEGSNIKEQTWIQGGVKRNYAFEYDGLSRLTSATFTGGINGENYSTAYSYDRQGNIETMNRMGKMQDGKYDFIDKLTYTYNGNQLVKITDAIDESAKEAGATDFVNMHNSGLAEITYNANGAMASDLHKGITDIQYNVLGLPSSISVEEHSIVNGTVSYLYNTLGVKVQVDYEENNNLRNMALMGTTNYASGTSTFTTVDYLGNKVYENNVLKRILIPGGYIEDNQYFYYLTDHLGNNRAVATASGNIIQRTQYYPFGLTFAEAQGAEKQPYKYNGKELDTRLQLGLVDYIARQNNTQYGRFTSIDPLAEKYYSISPYVYTANNPLRFIDPTGMAYGDYYAMNGTYLGTDDIDDNILYVVQNDNYQTDDVGNTIIFDETQMENVTEETGVTHSEFQQLAAFAYNETYDNNTIDKFRVANAIVNRQEEAGGTLQKSIDKLRYNNDSHEARMSNVQKLPGTATKAYAKFMNTTLGGRNNNAAMKNSNAAALNGISPTGIDYTSSIDGKTATQWRGARAGSGSTSNRFFMGFPVSSSNQITKFKYNNVLK